MTYYSIYFLSGLILGLVELTTASHQAKMEEAFRHECKKDPDLEGMSTGFFIGTIVGVFLVAAVLGPLTYVYKALRKGINNL